MTGVDKNVQWIGGLSDYDMKTLRDSGIEYENDLAFTNYNKLSIGGGALCRLSAKKRENLVYIAKYLRYTHIDDNFVVLSCVAASDKMSYIKAMVDLKETSEKGDEEQLVRENIANAENRIDTRMTWFLNFQGFLVASLSLSTADQFYSLRVLYCYFLYILSVVGIITSMSVWIVIRSEREFQKQTERQFEKEHGTPKFLFPFKRRSKYGCFLPINMFPALLVLFWTCIIVGSSFMYGQPEENNDDDEDTQKLKTFCSVDELDESQSQYAVLN